MVCYYRSHPLYVAVLIERFEGNLERLVRRLHDSNCNKLLAFLLFIAWLQLGNEYELKLRLC